MDKLSICIENIYYNFDFHLNNNRRILFSGQYGIGKTYFLKEYFRKFEDKYNVFHLFPVNYQVSQNQDIFELIKNDIVQHIILKGWLFNDKEKEKISKTLALQAYTIEKTSSITQNLLKLFTLGKSEAVVSAANQLEDIGNKFSKYYDELNQDMTLKTAKSFLESMQFEKGSAHEFDNISQLIYELLDNHKGEEEQLKENVLIIDDIDRIDPEHIFRILNVFSAHFDIEDEEKNKFGFDRIIFVCDIKNIRNIFCAKYGINTDFNGYINKFFSSHIYHFDNKIEIKKAIKDFVVSKMRVGKTHHRLNNIQEDIIQFLHAFIESDTINIRHLKNLENFNFNVSFFDYKRDEYLTMRAYWHLLNVLIKVFNNDKEKLISAFVNLSIDKEENRYFYLRRDMYLGSLLPLIDYLETNNRLESRNSNRNLNFIYRNKELDISILYELQNHNKELYAKILDIGFYDTEQFKYNSEKPRSEIELTRNITMKDIFNLFVVAINVADENGLLIKTELSLQKL